MKKLFYIALFIPLVFYSQEVFASSYNQGQRTYSTKSPSAFSLQSNNSRLQREVIEYNQSLPEYMKKLERSNQTFLDESVYSSPVPWGQEEYQKQNILQHKQPTPSDNTLKIQRETPNWWRQENSYQGWGFD